MKGSGDSGLPANSSLFLSLQELTGLKVRLAFCGSWGSEGTAARCPLAGCRNTCRLAELALSHTKCPNSSECMESWLLFYEETEVKRCSELSAGIIEA